MASEWEDVTLEDVADEITVGYVGPMASEYVDRGVPFLRSQNIEPLRINKKDLKFISPEFHQRIRKSRLRPGDVVIVRTGKPGSCSVVPPWFVDGNCSDLVIVRCGERINNHFLAYYINTAATHHVSSHLVGAVQQHFNVGAARTLRINLPPLSEQKRIAHILGTLDDKIELNRRMNATLEAIARALFQSWFVDFEPVRRNAEGCESRSEHSLFPDSFEDSKIGDVPKGWEVGSILREADLLSGGTPKTDVSDYWNGDIPWASAKDVSQCGETFLVSTERTITKLGVDKSATKIIPALSTVVVARGATTGRLTMFGDSMAMNQTCYALRSKVDAPFALYCHARHFIERLVQGSHGSVFETITTSTFEATDVLLAPKEVLLAFDEKVAPLLEQVRANIHQSRTLATLRDTLLPQLLSGNLSLDEISKEALTHV